MSHQKPLILVVDDDIALLKLMKRDLELEGYRVVTASDGKTALQLIKNEQPALVFLDVVMPGLDGFQVCKRIREFLQVPIIMLTARGQIEDVVRGLEAEVSGYIVKPFDSDRILAIVKRYLGRAESEE